MTKPSPEIYNRAADILREHGHSRGHLFAEDDTVCALGALYLSVQELTEQQMPPLVAAGTSYHWPAAQPLMAGLARVIHDDMGDLRFRSDFCTVAFFNDDARNDIDDVIHAFKFAAERADSGSGESS